MTETSPLAGMLVYLGQIGDPLRSDLGHAMRQLKSTHDRFQRGREELQEVCFWGKAVVGCLFGHMDAVGYAARKMAVLFHSMGGLALTNRELAKLSEVRYDRASDSLSRTPDLLNPLEGLKLGVKYFARLVGAEFELATGDERWRGVLDLWKARKDFTHPKRIEDLYAVEMFGSLQSSIAWYFSELMRLFNVCGRTLGIDVPNLPQESFGRELRPVRVDTQPMFTEGELGREIEEVAGRSLGYATHFFRILRYDTNRAALALKRVKRSNTSLASFAARLALRTEATQVEALDAALRFQLRAARRRREIDFVDEDLAPHPSHAQPVGRLIAAANLWSRELGFGKVLALDQTTASQVQEAWKRRDGLVHPKTPADLEITVIDALPLVAGLIELQRKAYECAEIDEEKWVQAAHRRQERT